MLPMTFQRKRAFRAKKLKIFIEHSDFGTIVGKRVTQIYEMMHENNFQKEKINKMTD